MRRLSLVILAATGMAGCYAEADYVAATPGGGVYVGASVPVGPPAPVSVSIAPPPPRYEPIVTCPYGQSYVSGQWDWNGSWYWNSGFCREIPVGYSYVPPVYSSGVYVRGYFAPGGSVGYRSYGSTYVPAPAPAYRPGYVPAPRPDL